MASRILKISVQISAARWRKPWEKQQKNGENNRCLLGSQIIFASDRFARIKCV